jgi:acyl-CoA-binding protein
MESEKKDDTIEQDFNVAQKFIETNKDPAIKLSNDDKLVFYGLYKQATIGECKSKLFVIFYFYYYSCCSLKI